MNVTITIKSEMFNITTHGDIRNFDDFIKPVGIAVAQLQAAEKDVVEAREKGKFNGEDTVVA